MILFILESSMFFFILHDIVTCDCDICDHPITGVMHPSYFITCVTIMLYSLPKFKIKKSKSENQSKIKEKQKMKNKEERK